MARLRRLSGQTPLMVHTARDAARRGLSRQQIADLLTVEFPSAPQSQINQIADREHRSVPFTSSLQGSDLRRSLLPSTAAGCADPNARVRVTVYVTVFSPTRGTDYQFGHTTDLSAGGRLRDVFQRAITETEQVAAGFGYRPLGITPTMRRGPRRYEISNVECY